LRNPPTFLIKGGSQLRNPLNLLYQGGQSIAE
jgi:hypothetical protein